MSMLTEVLTGGVRGGTSINFAAQGESISEHSGVVNLGTEGSMLCGALAAYAVAAETGHPWFGVLGGAIAGRRFLVVALGLTFALWIATFVFLANLALATAEGGHPLFAVFRTNVASAVLSLAAAALGTHLGARWQALRAAS